MSGTIRSCVLVGSASATGLKVVPVGEGSGDVVPEGRDTPSVELRSRWTAAGAALSWPRVPLVL